MNVSEEVVCQKEEKTKKKGYTEMKWLKKCRELFQGFCVKKADKHR